MAVDRGSFMAQLTYKPTSQKDKFARCCFAVLLFAIGLALGFEFYWLFGYWLIYCTYLRACVFLIQAPSMPVRTLPLVALLTLMQL